MIKKLNIIRYKERLYNRVKNASYDALWRQTYIFNTIMRKFNIVIQFACAKAHDFPSKELSKEFSSRYRSRRRLTTLSRRSHNVILYSSIIMTIYLRSPYFSMIESLKSSRKRSSYNNAINLFLVFNLT